MKGKTASSRGWALAAAAALVALLGIATSCGGQSGGDEAEGIVVATATPTAVATATTPPPSPTVTPVPPTDTPVPPTHTPIPPTATPVPPTPEPPTPTPLPPSPAPPPATEAPPAPPPPAPPPAPAEPAQPPAAGIELVPPEVGQGGVAVVRAQASGAVAADATFLGRRYPLLLQDGLAWGVLGVDALQEPGAYPVLVDLLAADGAVLGSFQTTLTVVDVAYPVEYVTLPPDRAALLDPGIVQEEINRRASIFSVFTMAKLWSGPFVMPVAGPIGGGYGAGRSYNDAPVVDFHHGADIIADAGVPVVASNSGRVAFAGALDVRGNSVIIDHGLGVFSAYHHLSQIAVVEGQDVAKGDVVGAVGDTGLATGPHLHWEIIVGGVNVDPLPWTAVEIGP